MADLTQDEITVLMIAAKGESMMPIGRWEAPVESLVAKGYLRCADKFNNYITDEGRKAATQSEDANLKDLIEVRSNIINVHDRAMSRAKELAVLLAELANYSAAATGNTPLQALKSWARIILEEAKGKLR